jgi:hypothetical protein
VEDVGPVNRIPGVKLLDEQVTARRPSRRRFSSRYWFRLGLDIDVFLDALKTIIVNKICKKKLGLSSMKEENIPGA